MNNIHEFAHSVWTVDGPMVRDTGFWFTTRMAIVRLSDGSLWVDSPVPVSFDTLECITGLGPVRYLVAATPRHMWRLESWHTLFPDAQLWSAKPTAFTLGKRRLDFTGILGNDPPQGWAADLDQLAFKGNPLIEEVLFFHKESGTVIMDDLVQNQELVKGKPFQNAVVKFGGIQYPHGGVGRDIRATFIDRKKARQSLSRLLSWDFDKLIIAHGPCVEKDAKAFVARAFRWLAH